jgi:hypothetical protein
MLHNLDYFLIPTLVGWEEQSSDRLDLPRANDVFISFCRSLMVCSRDNTSLQIEQPPATGGYHKSSKVQGRFVSSEIVHMLVSLAGRRCSVRSRHGRYYHRGSVSALNFLYNYGRLDGPTFRRGIEAFFPVDSASHPFIYKFGGMLQWGRDRAEMTFRRSLTRFPGSKQPTHRLFFFVSPDSMFSYSVKCK